MIRRCLSALRRWWRRPWRTLAIVGLLALISLGAAQTGLYFWVSYHFRAGQLDLERYHLDEARRHLHLCLRFRPDSFPTHLLAARGARQAGDLDEAQEQLEDCQRLLGQNSREDLRLERAALRAQRGETDPLLKYCQALVTQNDPAAPLMLEAMTQGYTRMFRIPDAEFCLALWLERQPDNTQALFLRGWVREHRDSYSGAAADYRRAVELDPERDDVRLRLVNSLLELNQPSDAAVHLEYLRGRHPDNLLVRVRLGACRHSLGQHEEAEKILDEVLVEAPHFPPALLARGRLALQIGQADSAEKCLRQLVAQTPGDYQALYLLYQALQQNHKEAEAQAAQTKMKAIHVDTTRMREIVSNKMTQTPNDPALHYEVGMILLRGGLVDEGIRWLKSALARDPRHAPTHAALAEYYQRMGDSLKAATHRQLAQPGRPGSTERSTTTSAVP